MSPETRKTSINITDMIMHTRTVLAGIIIVLFLLSGSNALSVELITEEEFIRDDSNIKDYPVKLLFRKFSEARGPEKDRIRNYIILKQVFSGENRKSDGSNVFDFKESFGVVRKMDQGRLKLWLPDTGKTAEFFLGIDMIPAEIPDYFDAKESNIGEYGCVIYTLDDRVYKLKAILRVISPEDINLDREGSNNILTWNSPSDGTAPEKYRVFRNGEFYKSVQENSIVIPRTEGKIDTYHVTSVYNYKNIELESKSSPQIYDEVTAKEYDSKTRAAGVYKDIITALNNNEPDMAKSLLYKQKELLRSFLDEKQKNGTKQLISFFNLIDEADAIVSENPENIDWIEKAVSIYKKALDVSKDLTKDINVSGLAESKITLGMDKIKALEHANKTRLAKNTYAGIIADISSGNYAEAEKTVKDSSSLLKEYLDKSKYKNITTLSEYFTLVNEGDAVLSAGPGDIERIEKAVSIYKKALDVSKDLTKDINASGLAESKIAMGADKLKALEHANKTRLAENTYAGIITYISSGNYAEAEKTVKDSSSLLKEYLDKSKYKNITTLSEYFTLVNEGDAVLSAGPGDIERIEKAASIYNKALDVSKDLTKDINASRLAESKIAMGVDKLKALEHANKTRLAENTYTGIITYISSGNYAEAEKTVKDSSSLLKEYLDKSKYKNITTLSEYFTLVNEGDAVLSAGPGDIERIEKAVSIYKKALDVSKDLPKDINASGLAELKIAMGVDKIKALEHENKTGLAENIYNEITASINRNDYEGPRKILTENRDLLDEYLDNGKKSNIASLAEIFESIDEGDRLYLDQSDSLRNINTAIRSYEKAVKKASELPAGINIASIADMKIKAGRVRKDLLEKRIEEKNAEETYNKILSLMTPLEWEKGKSLLMENNEHLLLYLSPEGQKTVKSMLSVLDAIDKGDSFRSMTPETKERLDTALSYYSRAGELSDNITGVINIRFISEQKIRDSLNRKKQLETRDKRNLARERYDEITGTLSSENWEKGKELIAKHRLFLMDYLDDFLKDNIKRLTDFFKDIDDGDELLNRKPVSLSSLDNALSLYKKAEQKSEGLPEGIDLRFITENRISLCSKNKQRLEQEEKRQDEKEPVLITETKEEPAVKEPEDSGVTIVLSSDVPAGEEDIREAAQKALTYFNDRVYDKSWDNFNIAYRKQIARIQRGGKNKIMGALGLPAVYRAEIFFLIELENIGKSLGNKKITRNDLRDMITAIESNASIWALIKDDTKKKKIIRHIRTFRSNFYNN